jgi:hypothetical protein|tara:strand:+ start:1160 stop:1549 length:390 start_codon:yes stop_codon:yes gene_type:complete
MDEEEEEIREILEDERKDLKPNRVYIILEDIEKNPLRENALFTELNEEEEVDDGYFNVKVIDTTNNSDPRESMSFIISQGLFCILQESLMEVYTKGSQYILNQMGDNVVDLLPNLLNKAKGPPNGSGYH